MHKEPSLAKEPSVPNELHALTVHIRGDFQSGSFDAQVAQALVQLQQVVYRLAAKTLYGSEATINALSEDDLVAFRLHFVVSKGSTNIEAGVWQQASALVKAIVKNMTPAQKLVLAGLVSACFLGYIAEDVVKEYFKNEASVKLNQEETKRMAILLQRASDAGMESTGNFVKAAKGAASVSVGGRNYSKQDINDAQKRAPKQYISWEVIQKAFNVVALDCSKQDIIIATLVDPSTQEAIKASYTAENDEDEAADAIRSTLALALASGRLIDLEVNVGRKGDHVEKSTILNVIEEDGASEKN